jgi:hypothetical protein
VRHPTHQEIIKIRTPRRTGDPNAPALSFPAQRAIPRCPLSNFIAIGQHDHVPHLARQFEAAKA